MTPDPIDPPEVPEVPAPAPAPAPPPYDRELAFQIVAEELGYDPQVAKFELEETKRRRQDLDRRDRELQARERQIQDTQRYEPVPDGVDPSFFYMNQKVDRLVKSIEDRDRKEQEREAKDTFVQTLARGMDVTYRSLARQAGMTKEQIDQQSDQFYEVLTDIYPEPEMIRALGPDKAVMTAFRLFKNGNGSQPTPSRNPRTPYVVPVGTGGGVQALQDDLGARREGESQSDYVARLRRALDAGGATMASLPERAVINPG